MATKVISLPNNWKPRHYQRDLWKFLSDGGKRAVLRWHRRSGKDEVLAKRGKSTVMRYGAKINANTPDMNIKQKKDRSLHNNHKK